MAALTCTWGRGRDRVAEAYRLYGAAIWRRCRRVLHDGDRALDVTQEVFIRCLRHHRTLRAGRELLAWLYRVATNLCLNELRGRKVVRLSAQGAPPERAVAPEADSRVGMTLASAWLALRAVWDAGLELAPINGAVHARFAARAALGAGGRW